MHSLSNGDLKSLLENKNGFCVSLFMPTYRTGAESQQNQIRFRNLIRHTEDKLMAINLRPPEIRTLLTPVQALAGNMPFWRHQRDGLAIFLSGSLFRYYCLPLLFDELIVVSDRFHIKPLLPLLHDEEQYYILAISQNSVRFLEGSRYGIKDVELAGLPKSLAETLATEAPVKQVRFHAGVPGGGERGAMLSGHGAELEDGKDNLLKYFRQIDRGLHSFLKDGRAPLVLTGVDYLFPIYHEANTYPYLREEGVAGNPEGWNMEQLHRQAWQIVAPYFQKAETDALSQYRQSSGTGLTSGDIREIVAAAYHGRAGVLFVALGQQQWGTFSPASGEVLLRQYGAAESEDLLDLAAMHTFLNGGTVFAVPQEEIPGRELAAAVFRY